MLSLAVLGLASTQASAWFFDGCCRGCGKCSTVLCIRQYNAFSPICSGCVTCCGCMPFCPQSCGCGPRYAPPAYAPPCYDAGCGACPTACGAPSSCASLPPITYGPAAGYSPAPAAPVYAPTPQPMPAGPQAMMSPAYYPQVQPAAYMGYYGYQGQPMGYGYNPMAPMMR